MPLTRISLKIIGFIKLTITKKLFAKQWDVALLTAP
jgi:hypothetical protein